MLDFLREPWPWYVAGPLIGLIVPTLLWVGRKQFGVSENLRHLCAATLPGRSEFLRYDWRGLGAWNLAFAAGILSGGFLGGRVLGAVETTAGVSTATRRDLGELGIAVQGFLPADIFSWAGLATPQGLLLMIGGGFLVGFGARWAGGCTSGHAITGVANLQVPSIVAMVGFFVGGLLATHLLLPLIFGGAS